MAEIRPFLEVRNLRVWYPVRRGFWNRVCGHIRAVDGVSFALQEGETLAVVGESGCGKTTLGRAIVGLEPPTEGEIFYEGKTWRDLDKRQRSQWRRDVQMVFQDPFASLNPRFSAMDAVTEGLVQHGLLNGRTREEAAAELLAEVGLESEMMFRYPHEFSGGQRQRLSIARALSLSPRLVVCDEPVSALDVSVQAQIINLLLDLRSRRHLTLLFISHDLSVVRLIATQVAVMYLGKLVETGRPEQVLDAPAHPYTRALAEAVPRPGGKREIVSRLSGDFPSPLTPPEGCVFHQRCSEAGPECSERQPALKECSDGRCVACQHCQL